MGRGSRATNSLACRASVADGGGAWCCLPAGCGCLARVLGFRARGLRTSTVLPRRRPSLLLPCQQAGLVCCGGADVCTYAWFLTKAYIGLLESSSGEAGP